MAQMTEQQKQDLQEKAAAFWNAAGVRAELSHWVKLYGNKQGASVFWGLQQTLDLMREHYKGKPLTRADIDGRHTQALRWNALMDEDIEAFWKQYHYEACVTNQWVQEAKDFLGLHSRAGDRYGKCKTGAVLVDGGVPNATPATDQAEKRYVEQVKKQKVDLNGFPF
jgi:hypothetical protein